MGSADTFSHPSCRPRRRFRRERPRPMTLTRRDAAVVHRVFLSRFCTAQSTFLFAREAEPKGGGDNWSKRLRALYDAGWITRLYLPQSRYVGGSQWPVYCVETGVAAQASELRKPWSHIERSERARIATASAPMRQQLVHLLTSQFGLPEEDVTAGLRAATQHALKLYSGESCHVPHLVLASTFCSIVWHGLARAGASVGTVRPDGAMDLNELADGALESALLPDTFFVAGDTAFCLEAETGTSSRAKIQAKVGRYIAFGRHGGVSRCSAHLGRAIKRLRVIFHCATAAHLQMVAGVIAEQEPSGTPLFLLSNAATFHLDYSQLHFRRNLRVESADRPLRLYDALSELVSCAVLAQVEGRRAQRPVLGYVALTAAL